MSSVFLVCFLFWPRINNLPKIFNYTDIITVVSPKIMPFLPFVLFFFLINKLINLAVLGLHCCMRAFSSCGEQGLLFIAVRGLLVVVASLVAEHGL